MSDKLTKLIVSSAVEIIGGRFQVKISIFDNDVDKKSILVVVLDMVEHGFSMKYFNNNEDVLKLLQLLNSVGK